MQRFVRRALTLFLPLALFCAFFAAPTLGKVHSWVDDKGVLHFSDKPGDETGRKPRTRVQESDATSRQKGPLFMWKVTAGNNYAYLLGSMHYARRGLYPLDPRIEKAFDTCKVLAVESDVENHAAEIQKLTMELGMYPQGDSLDKHISSRTKRLLEDAGAMNPLFMRMKAWLLAMQLQSQRFMQLGYDPEQGLDRFFLRKAGNRHIKIKELERARDTLQLLAKAAEGQEDLYLYYSLQELDRIEEIIPKLSDSWKSGDTAAMRQLIFEELNRHPEFRDLGKMLFDERNEKMAAKIAQYLQSGVPHFIVVGAGHLVGPQGIPALLKQRGYAVTQIGAGEE